MLGEFDDAYIRPNEKRTEETLVILVGVFSALLALLLSWNVYTTLKAHVNLKSILGRIFGSTISFASSRKAERDFMRFKRLFDNGLITEQEFNAKKKELKSKILRD